MIQRTLLASLLILAACGDDDDSPSYQRSCADGCARAHGCNSSVDVRECTDDCEDQLADIGPQLSGAYLAGIDACVHEQSCNEFVFSTLTNSCAAESQAKLRPSAASEALCEKVTDSIKECTGLSTGAAGCLDATKIFADGPLRKAARCSEEPCDQRAGCLREALGLDLSDSGS
jgi:hypothetical protein